MVWGGFQGKLNMQLGQAWLLVMTELLKVWDFFLIVGFFLLILASLRLSFGEDPDQHRLFAVVPSCLSTCTGHVPLFLDIINIDSNNNVEMLFPP